MVVVKQHNLHCMCKQNKSFDFNVSCVNFNFLKRFLLVLGILLEGKLCLRVISKQVHLCMIVLMYIINFLSRLSTKPFCSGSMCALCLKLRHI